MSLTISELIKQSHDTAVSKGWWDTERSFGDQVANMHAELSEAWEEYRQFGLAPRWFLWYNNERQEGNPFGEHADKPEGIAAEFADVLIRIADTCGKYNIPLEEALEHKLHYNTLRPHRHGGKVA